MKASAGSSRAITNARTADVRASSTVERFRLSGPSLRLDPRVNAARGDLADRALADRLFAPYYADPVSQACIASSTMMRCSPADDAVAVSQLLSGETFEVLDVAGGWSWGYSTHDHYVGYVASDALGPMQAPTHAVVSTAALLFAGPNIKAPVKAILPIGARIAGTAEGDFLATAGGYLHRRHVAAISDFEPDPVAVAERLIGQPYLWGGRGGGGIDCSGLIQLCFGLCGVPLPRDSDQQRTSGEEIAASRRLRRGDVVFFPGHVGIMADPDTLLHANAYWMAVTAEPLSAVVSRLTPHHPQPIIARRRLLP